MAAVLAEQQRLETGLIVTTEFLRATGIWSVFSCWTSVTGEP